MDSAALIDEFQQLTGKPLAWPALENLPDSFCALACLTPGEILAAGLGQLSRRTVNVLRRALTEGDHAGPWTYARLSAVRGFGFMTLLEVLRLEASLPAHAQRRIPVHRQLDEELERLLARTHDRTTRTPTPALDRAVALIGGALPASEATILRRLRTGRLIKEPFDLSRLERALRFRDPPCPFVFLRRPGLSLVVAHHQLRLAALIHERAQRALTTRGSVTVEQVALLTGTDDLALVRAVLSAHEAISWLRPGQRRRRELPPSAAA